MKQPKRPTRAQKEIIYGHKLNARNWMVISEDAEVLVVQYKFGKSVKRLKKGVNLWRT